MNLTTPTIPEQLRQLADKLERQNDLEAYPDREDACSLREWAAALEQSAPPQRLINLARTTARRLLELPVSHVTELHAGFTGKPAEQVTFEQFPIGQALALQRAAEETWKLTNELMGRPEEPAPTVQLTGKG